MRHSQNLRLSRKPSCHLTAFSSFGTSGKQSKAKSFSKSCFPKPSTTTPCPPPPLLLAVAQAREPSLLCAVGLQESAQCQQHWAAAKQPKPRLRQQSPEGFRQLLCSRRCSASAEQFFTQTVPRMNRPLLVWIDLCFLSRN